MLPEDLLPLRRLPQPGTRQDHEVGVLVASVAEIFVGRANRRPDAVLGHAGSDVRAYVRDIYTCARAYVT